MFRFLSLVLLLGALHAETVLVVPFFNHSQSNDLDWIGESIAESVQDSLASENVLVLDREDRLEAFRRLSLRSGAELTRASMIKLGEALDASRVVYGDYELLPPGEAGGASKGSLRLTARILDLKRTRVGPSFAEVGAVEDLATLQSRLGWQVLTQVKNKNTPTEQQFTDARPRVRLDAMESYVRGLLSSSREQRHRFFTQAARLDEHFSQPCYQLGKAYFENKEYKIAGGWLTRVQRTDPHYLEAHFFLGLSRFQSGDLAGAEEAFQSVASEIPLNEVYNDLGVAQARREEFDAAAASFEKALEGDSGDPDYHFNLGYLRWRQGQFDAAATSFRAVLDRNSGDAEATVLLGRCLQRQGPRPGETRFTGRERIKTNYEETAYRQLQAELDR